MSERYQEEIKRLTEWFVVELPDCGMPPITPNQYSVGIDSLPNPWKSLCEYGFQKWLYGRKYELSYNQMCKAFFAALRAWEKSLVAKEGKNA